MDTVSKLLLWQDFIRPC